MPTRNPVHRLVPADGGAQMIDFQSLEDLSLLRESVSLECKLANGRDGKGALPEDFWPTYSAMANADGGVVVLGMRERQGRFEPAGIANAEKVRAELFNNLNNRQKVSVNLLTDAHVREWMVQGKTLLVVEIPRARRRQRPVFLTTNPFGGNTYRRLNEGDRPLADDDVKRMLAGRWTTAGMTASCATLALKIWTWAAFGPIARCSPTATLATPGTKRTIRPFCAVLAVGAWIGTVGTRG